MFQLPFYYVGLGVFTFCWLVGMVSLFDWLAGAISRFKHVSIQVGRDELRTWLVIQTAVILLAIVLFKWVVLEGGPGIAVNRVLSGPEGSNWIAYPAAAGVCALVAVGLGRVIWRVVRFFRKPVKVVQDYNPFDGYYDRMDGGKRA